ncbi:MAG: hypothetical protein V1706_08785 [Pseudomonadota bacterium]
MDQAKNIHDELASALSEFAAMQQHHAALLAEGRLKTLPEWTVKRDRVFQRLQQCFEHFDPDMLDEKSESAMKLGKIMEKILNDERLLIMQVQNRKEKIREKMRTLRRGKTVLRGYGLKHGAGPKPKYLSSKA